ncbi:MFS transporter [Streptomyces sp. NEAU-H3]|uniref:MFS transporter n=1 Tax=Streptomyces sp. NEAU-H3 TaxID=2720636 RepID=UPI00280B0D43|nr:MFS transporter [Streptomyces sp. NEAU-H3]
MREEVRTHENTGHAPPERTVAVAGPASAGRAFTGRLPDGALLPVMAVVVVCSGVTQGYITPLLPGVGRHVGVGGVGQNNLYLLSQVSFAVLTPLLSRLGDLFGHRRLLRLSVAAVALGSLLMALRPSVATLSAGMVLQSSVVGFFPLLAGILRTRAPERGRTGMSVLVGALLLSIGIGGLIAGTLSDHHAVEGLWTAVPVALLAVLATLLLPAGRAARAGRFHYGAALLLGLGLVGLVLVLAQGAVWGWVSGRSLGCGLAGVVLLVCWVLVERRATHPLVQVRLLGDPRLAVVNAHTFCLAFGAIGFLGANAVFLGTDGHEAGYGPGLGSQAISLVSLGMVAAGCAASTATPYLARRTGDRAMLLTGGIGAALGFLLLVVLHGSLGQYLLGALVVGCATGVFEAVTRSLATEAVPGEETAVSVGVNELSLSLGAAIGAAVIGALFAAHPGRGGHPAQAGFVWAWGVCAAVALLGALTALVPSAFRERPATVPPARG